MYPSKILFSRDLEDVGTYTQKPDKNLHTEKCTYTIMDTRKLMLSIMNTEIHTSMFSCKNTQTYTKLHKERYTYTYTSPHIKNPHKKGLDTHIHHNMEPNTWIDLALMGTLSCVTQAVIHLINIF